MKRALLLIEPALLVQMFKGSWPRTFEVTDFALPEDARFVDVRYINTEGRIALELESETFNEVPEKAKTPVVLSAPVYRVVDEEPLVLAIRHATSGCLCEACTDFGVALKNLERCHRAPQPTEQS
jgi:hypothetical protein